MAMLQTNRSVTATGLKRNAMLNLFSFISPLSFQRSGVFVTLVLIQALSHCQKLQSAAHPDSSWRHRKSTFAHFRQGSSSTLLRVEFLPSWLLINLQIARNS